MTNYKVLGRTGVKVSKLCYGTMACGGDADEATSEQMYRRIRELGINFLIRPMSIRRALQKRSWGG